jgi:hypothetical protein
LAEASCFGVLNVASPPSRIGSQAAIIVGTMTKTKTIIVTAKNPLLNTAGGTKEGQREPTSANT